jgi:hypothetical protein
MGRMKVNIDNVTLHHIRQATMPIRYRSLEEFQLDRMKWQQ